MLQHIIARFLLICVQSLCITLNHNKKATNKKEVKLSSRGQQSPAVPSSSSLYLYSFHFLFLSFFCVSYLSSAEMGIYKNDPSCLMQLPSCQCQSFLLTCVCVYERMCEHTHLHMDVGVVVCLCVCVIPCTCVCVCV